ncbi:MAG: ATP-dependent Clp protease proteolytic subunit [Acidimicrobiales bacterium]
MNADSIWPPEVPMPERPPGWPPERTPAPPQVTVPIVPMEPDRVAERLFERRMVLASGFLDQPLATHVAAQLMLLDATDDRPIDLHLSCADGDLDAAAALADTIDLMGVTVRALARGTVGGAALAVLVAAPERRAQPHVLFVLREPKTQLEGRASDLATLVAQHQNQLDALCTRLASATGQTVDRIAADLRSGTMLTAKEAVLYGLIHEIANPTPKSRQ